MKNLNFNANEILGRAELKTVVGGVGGSCCNTVTYADGYQYRTCGLSASQAQSQVGLTFDHSHEGGPATVTHWCCESC